MSNNAANFIKRYFYAAGSCPYLFTFGVLKSRNRALINHICDHFGFDPDRAASLLPVRNIAGAAPEDTSIEIREPVVVDGNVTLLEIVVIARLLKSRSPRAIFEIGTFDGRTTLNLAANSPADARVYTLDLPRSGIDSTEFPIDNWDRSYINKDASGARFAGADLASKITGLYGDSAKFDFSPYNGGMDFVFVDGAHTYEYVLNDTKVALKLLRDGKGMVVWHDYGFQSGVTRALNELLSAEPSLENLFHVEGTSLACCEIG